MSSRPDSTLTRLQPAVLTIAAVAATLTLYYLHQSVKTASESSSAAPNSPRLRRSNAVRHPQRERTRRLPRRSSSPTAAAPTDDPSSSSLAASPTLAASGILEQYRRSTEVFGEFEFASDGPTPQSVTLPLRRPVPPPSFFEGVLEVSSADAPRAQRAYQVALVRAVLGRLLPDGAGPRDLESAAALLAAEEGLAEDTVADALQGFHSEALDTTPEWRRLLESRDTHLPLDRRRSSAPSPERRPTDDGTADLLMELDDWDDNYSIASPPPGPGGAHRPGADDDSRKEGQSLLNMLYHIAEEQARREGYVHRGVSCNACHAHPIRGVRYRCANCVDFDLCEACEALQPHTRTHLFYKIRVPAPYLGNPRQPQPVWYPGRGGLGLPNHLPRATSRGFVERSGFEPPEVDALWDQFKCLAAADWPDDPHRFGVAIDRDTFDRCFMPNRPDRRPTRAARAHASPPTLLIYDRMFTFYDTNADGLIGFDEFVLGLAAMRSKAPRERARRIFHGYDHDRDGYVGRRDFLLMFRAFYALTKELTHDMVAGMEEELLEGGSLRDNVAGTQPISAAYTGSIPYPDTARAGEGKAKDQFGDAVVRDGAGAILDDVIDEGDPVQIVGDVSELKELGVAAAPRRASGSSSASSSADPDAPPPPRESQGAPNTLSRVSTLEHRSATGAMARHNSVDASASAGTPAPSTRRDRVLSDGATLSSALEMFNGGPRESGPRERARSRAAETTHNHGPGRTRIPVPERVRGSSPTRPPPPPPRADDAAQRREAREQGLQRRRDRRAFHLDEADAVPASRPSSSTAPGTATPSSSLEAASRPDARPSAPSRPDSRPPAPPPSAAWLRFPPPLDADVGREILYQITQEGLNELLDPLFKHREDLAVEAWRARDDDADRAGLETQIEAFGKDKMKELCALQVARLQRKWRQTDRNLGASFRVGEELKRAVHAQGVKGRPEYVQNLHDMGEVGMLGEEELRDRLAEVQEGPSGAVSGESSKRSALAESTHMNGSAPEDLPAESQKHHSQTSATDASNGNDVGATREEAGRVQDTPEPNADPTSSAPSHTPPPAGAATTLEEAVLNTDIKSLLEAAGYAAPPGTPAAGPTASAPEASPDPTLPQNRPSQPTRNRDDWTPAFRERLKYLAMLDAVTDEDEARGGAGKLSFAEFEEILTGPRGANLGFLGSWIELVNF